MRFAWIAKLQRDYAERFGAPPVNVSHWNVAPSLESALRPVLKLPARWWGLNYITGVSSRIAESVATKLAISTHDRHLLLCPSSTDAIECVLGALYRSSVRELTIVSPFYFAVKVIAEQIGFETRLAPVLRVRNSLKLPSLRDAEEAIWITNPIYSTGVHADTSIAREIQSVLRRRDRFVIIDESLAQSGKGLSQQLKSQQNLFTIYSPHKSIAVNTHKFSLVAGPAAFSEALQDIADVSFGGLPASSLVALHHFTSRAFDRYDAAFRRYVERARAAVRSLGIADFQLDTAASGHFMMCYFPRLDARLGLNRRFMWGRMKESGAIAIPAVQDFFDPSLGFAFRLNLALDSRSFRAAVRRWLAAISRASLASIST